jgi:nucleoside phosphorylase
VLFRAASEVLAEADRLRLRRTLIATALEVEIQAVLAHLTDVCSVRGHDGTVFECGRFSTPTGDWLVVTVQCGEGNLPSASVVQVAMASFERFETIMFSGIAGTRKKDLPIGGVIASTKVYSPYGGKSKAGSFLARPKSIDINYGFLELAKKVCRDNGWQGRIIDPINSPLPRTDDPKYPKPFPPKAIPGPIVSQESVSGDPFGELEKFIKNNYNDAKAVEMEGFGTVYAAQRVNIPCIVVRGISDAIADKEDDTDAITQPIAAAHAAAFALELLSMWSEVVASPFPPAGVDSGVSIAPIGYAESQTKLPPGNAITSDGHRVQMVMKLAGAPQDYPPERVTQIEHALRDLTGDPLLSVVRTEAGSFRMVVDTREGDISLIRSEQFRGDFTARTGAVVEAVVLEDDKRHTERAIADITAAPRELLSWPRTLPDGTALRRPELDQLIQTLTTAQSSTTALLGDPGSGKSALLAELGNEMIRREWPVLAIKADLIEPNVNTEDDLKSRLGFSTSIADTLFAVALMGPVLLLIDQLDALAGYVDLKTGRLTVLLNLVRRAAGHKNIHIVLSARTFEYEHDVRLRSVSADNLHLELPAWSRVEEILARNNVAAKGWPVDAQLLLRSPHALNIFLRLDRREAKPYETYHLMLERLWSERVLTSPESQGLIQLASDIAELMAEEETLWLAAARFDQRLPFLHALVAMGLLRLSDNSGSVGFAHQTIFDHVLARNFASGKSDLSDFTLSREASLFVRPKLWASLTYLRAVERTKYDAELIKLWTSPTLRPHLRQLLIEFVGQQGSPDQVEISQMTALLASDGDRATGLRAITGSQGWFEIFKKTRIADAMMAEPAIAWKAAELLRAAIRFAASDVVALVRQHWLADSANDLYAWNVLEGQNNWTDEAIEALTTIISRTNIHPSQIDWLAGEIGVTAPAGAMKLVRAKLDDQLSEARAESDRRMAEANTPDNIPTSADDEHAMLLRFRAIERSPIRPFTKLLETSSDWGSVPALAESAPHSFLDVLFPWFLTLLRRVRDLERAWDEHRYALRYVGHLDLDIDSVSALPESNLFSSLRVAIEKLAQADPDAFLSWTRANDQEDAMPIQRLIAHGMATNPDRYARESAHFLLGDIRRFVLGDSQDDTSTTANLIRRCSRLWNSAQLVQIQQQIIGYALLRSNDSRPDVRQWFMRSARRVRLALLQAVPEDLRLDEVRKLITEETRAFGDKGKTSISTGVVHIGSPMTPDEMVRASNEDILNAFRKLPDETEWNNPKRWDVGGNVQLSRAFAEFAKSNRDRAFVITSKFERTFGQRAAAYAIDALSETEPSKVIEGLIFALVQKGFDNAEFRIWTARAIERLVQRNDTPSDEVASLLRIWIDDAAKSSSTAESDEAVVPTKKAPQDEVESILWSGPRVSLEPLDGFQIVEAYVRLLLAKGKHDELATRLSAMVGEGGSFRFWHSLLRFMRYIKPSSEEIRVGLLTKLYDAHPQLVRSSDNVGLLASMLTAAPSFVGTLIVDWPRAEDSFTRQAYGELVALAALAAPAADWAENRLAQAIESGSEEERTGIAFAASHLWAERKYRAKCGSVIASLAPKATPKIWTALLDAFRTVDELPPDTTTTELLRAIRDYGRNARLSADLFIVDRLEGLLPYEPVLVAEVATLLVSEWKNDLSDIRTSMAATAPQLVNLAITLHRLGPQTRELGTALFEDLLSANAISARETMNEIDCRLIGTVQSFRRARLPRRVPRRRAR